MEGVHPAGFVAVFEMSADGRVDKVVGLSPESAGDTRHFVASMDMVADTLLSLWADSIGLHLGPLGPWAARAGRFWVVHAGRRLWLLDGDRGDPCELLLRAGGGRGSMRKEGGSDGLG